MHCSNCGAAIDPKARHCSQCGAQVRLSTTPSQMVEFGLRECPRCGYRGEGTGYFSRPAHMGILIGLSAITYLVGGAIYWLAKRSQKVCPNCGMKWELARFYSSDEERRPAVHGIPQGSAVSLPRSGIIRRVLGGAVTAIGLLAVIAGLVEGDIEPIMGGLVMGFVGSSGFWWGYAALQSRRKAIDRQMEKKILQLAHLRGGTLTVTEVAARLDLSLPAAEKLLVGMDDGLRIRSDVTSEGLIVYEFPEVRHMKQLESGSSG